jgi:hypothetical protein
LKARDVELKGKHCRILYSSVADPEPKNMWIRWIHMSELWIRILLWIRIRILLSSCKNSKKNLDSYYFVTLFDFLCLKNDVNVASKSKKQKKFCKKICFLLAS